MNILTFANIYNLLMFDYVLSTVRLTIHKNNFLLHFASLNADGNTRLRSARRYYYTLNCELHFFRFSGLKFKTLITVRFYCKLGVINTVKITYNFCSADHD